MSQNRRHSGSRGGYSIANLELVGVAGFEPATTRTPSVCATSLRHTPTQVATIYFRSWQDHTRMRMSVRVTRADRIVIAIFAIAAISVMPIAAAAEHAAETAKLEVGGGEIEVVI